RVPVPRRDAGANRAAVRSRRLVPHGSRDPRCVPGSLMSPSSSSRRIRVLLLFGGRSAEHDVSRVTAVAVANALDPSRYQNVPIAITTHGRRLFPREAQRMIQRGPRAPPPPPPRAGEPAAAPRGP